MLSWFFFTLNLIKDKKMAALLLLCFHRAAVILAGGGSCGISHVQLLFTGNSVVVIVDYIIGCLAPMLYWWDTCLLEQDLGSNAFWGSKLSFMLLNLSLPSQSVPTSPFSKVSGISSFGTSFLFLPLVQFFLFKSKSFIPVCSTYREWDLLQLVFLIPLQLCPVSQNINIRESEGGLSPTVSTLTHLCWLRLNLIYCCDSGPDNLTLKSFSPPRSFPLFILISHPS